MNKIIIYLFLVIIISSCSPYGSIMIQTTKPAAFHIPKDSKSICFAIRQPMTMKYKNLIDSSKRYKEIHKEVLKFYDISFEGFYDEINKTKRFDRIMHYIIKPEIRKDSTKLQALNWLKTGLICTKTNSDILISLEEASLIANMNNSRTKYNFSWDYTFRVYDTYNFKILETFKISDSYNSMINNTSVHSELEWNAYKVGQLYAKHIMPTQEQIERLYYNKGNVLIKLGTYYLKRKSYEKALSIWKRALAETKELELKYKIYFNLALVEEMRGNYSLAIIYAKSSLQFFSKAIYNEDDKILINKRIIDLKLRLKHNKILNQ